MIGSWGALDPLRVGILKQVRESSGGLDVLANAISTDPLVSFLAILHAQTRAIVNCEGYG